MVQQVTRGIKIEVKQNFEGTFYKNHKIHFAFGYVVTIENRSKDTVQLNSRHWTILDSLNKNDFYRINELKINELNTFKDTYI